jgi:hypothetical protein
VAASEFDPDQVHDEIAQLRGQVDKLNEVIGTTTGAPIQVTDPLVATDPVNGGPETWHANTLAGTFTASNPVPQYRLTASPASTVEMLGQVTFTAGAGNNIQWNSAALAAAYCPATNQSCHVIIGGGATAPTRTPIFTITTGGNMTFFGIPNDATFARWHVFVSLDAT